MGVGPKVILRPMVMDDVPLLDCWDRQPHVIAATSDDPSQTKAFGDTCWPDELAMVAPDYQYFIAELEGRAIGAMQVIDPHTEPTHYWGDIEPNLRAIDIWIGSADDLGKGYGEQMMRRAFQLCFSEASVAAIVIDPLASNQRACRFYQRLGFVPEGRQMFDGDDCLVHRLTRAAWQARFPDDVDGALAAASAFFSNNKEKLDMDELRGKVAIVTGASRGIGAVAAREFAAAGSSVVLASRTTRQTEEIAQQIRNAGGRAVAVACDVANYADVEAMVAAAVDQFGAVDMLVNNAGLIDPIARLAESDPEAWTTVATTNYLGVYNGIRAALPRMVAKGGGVIVNVSSGAATSALEGWSHYCSSKAAALMLTRCADKEYRQHNVRVVGLSPGTVATDMQVAIKKSGINPVSQLDPSVHIPPEWAAKAIVWLCTKAAQDLSGEDFSLKDEAGRKRVGLPA